MKDKTIDVNLTIDPGLNGTGIAIWDINLWENPKHGIFINPPIKVFSFYEKHFNEYIRICNYLLKINGILSTYFYKSLRLNVKNIYIEEPSFFDSEKGRVTARSDSLRKLCHFVGFMHGYFLNIFPKSSVKFIPIINWKGQAPKEVIQKRIIKLLGEEHCKQYKNSHVFDAVGIGLYLQGFL